MKIGILTQPLWANYGGSIQNFALQTFLKKLGHEPVTLRAVPFPRLPNGPQKLLWRKIFARRISFKKRVVRAGLFFYRAGTFFLGDWWAIDFAVIVLARILKTLLGKRRGNVFSRCGNGETPEFKAFHDAWINYRWMNFPPRWKKNCDCDAFVVGSDQVWRPAYNNQNLLTMFLDFARSRKNIRRVAYAASFGLDNASEFHPEILKICARLLQKFDAVSVREDSGVGLCRDYFGVNGAEHLLDPTLLLDAEDYCRVCASVPARREDFVASYILDKSAMKTATVEKVAGTLNCGNAELNGLSVPEWLAGFRDAQFVVTDSFHGTVFSIIFNKPFIAVGNAARGMARFDSLLKMFGLRERLVLLENAGDAEILELVQKPVDWQNVNATRSRERVRSREFLEKALGKNSSPN